MNPSRVCLMLTLILTAGCAALAGPPPSPPLAVPAVDPPNEFTWSPFKWRPGIVLTYHLHSFTEINPEGREDSHKEDSHAVIQYKGVDKTAIGSVRVQMLVDDTELGIILMDELGEFQDAIASKPEFTPALTLFAELMKNLPLKQSQLRPLAVGETITSDVPMSNWRRLMPRDWGQYLVSSVTLRCQFTGYVRLGETLAAAFRSEMPNMLGSPILARDRNNRELRIRSLVGESLDYYDPVEGYIIAKYEVTTGGGEVGGKPIAFRLVRLTTLDREQSRGLQSPRKSSLSPSPRPAGTLQKKVYELSQEDLPTGEEIRSAELSVFGVKLGSTYSEVLTTVSKLGRPFREQDVSSPPMKAVAVFFGEDEAAREYGMVVFHAKDDLVRQIFLYGSTHLVRGTGAPPLKGFDAITVGNSKTLLNKCNEQDRWRLLGREDRQTQKDFPRAEWRYTVYEYDRPSFALTHSVGKLKSSDSFSVEYCVLRIGQSMLAK